jgi:GDP-L-fucose synthase
MTDLRGTSVLITGGTGFLGSYLVTELAAAGAKTVALRRTDYDLRVRSDVARMLDENAPDMVVHLAATVGGIRANDNEPGRFFFDNAVMGIQLLEECRIHGIDKVLVLGTVCSYPAVTECPFREDDLWLGYPEPTNAPYGLAKRMVLVQAQAYRQQYGMNTIFLMPVNLYGPGDNVDLETSHVIPGMIRRLIEARDAGHPTATLWGDGTPTREFLHVADAARACRMALEHYDDGAPVNVGSGREISIHDLARLLADNVGYQGALVWDPSQPNGQQRRLLDTSRARDLFGFTAQIPFESGIAETVQWYEETVAGTGPSAGVPDVTTTRHPV